MKDLVDTQTNLLDLRNQEKADGGNVVKLNEKIEAISDYIFDEVKAERKRIQKQRVGEKDFKRPRG